MNLYFTGKYTAFFVTYSNIFGIFLTCVRKKINNTSDKLEKIESIGLTKSGISEAKPYNLLILSFTRHFSDEKYVSVGLLHRAIFIT